MQEPSRKRVKHWIYPGKDRLSLLSPWTAIHLALVTLAGALLVAKLARPGMMTLATEWLIASITVGLLACLWTLLYAAYATPQDQARILRMPLVLTIGQVVTLIIAVV
jgi:hypothetical protein